METAMSLALAKAGLITEEQAAHAEVLPRKLKPFARQIHEIQQLTDLFARSSVEVSLPDILETLAFIAMRERGEHAEAYNMMLTHLRKKARMLNLTLD